MARVEPIAAPTTEEDLARSERARMVREALATIRLEGLEPHPEVISLSEQYIEGKLTGKQLTARVAGIFRKP